MLLASRCHLKGLYDAVCSFEENSPVCQGIADAASHQYVKGKWAYINTTDKLSCMIVGVTIPSSGECTHLKRYLCKWENANFKAPGWCTHLVHLGLRYSYCALLHYKELHVLLAQKSW